MSVTEAVRVAVKRQPPGEPFSNTMVLGLGPRAAVDQALSRLVAEGAVSRVCRGVYMRPRTSRLVGNVPADPEAVIRAIAASTGEIVVPTGATAANQLGLTTQVPLGHVYRTSGRSRDVRVGRTVVRLRHASARQLAMANTPAGAALAALRYLGPGVVTERTISQVRRRIGRRQFAVLRGSTGVMPAWLSDKMWHYSKAAHTP